MSQDTEMILPNDTVSLIPEEQVQERVNTMLANRKYIVEQVKPLLIEGVDIYQFEGMKKPSLGKPGAEKLAAIFGLQASFQVDKETIEAIGQTEKKYIAYVCILSRNEKPVGEGRGATFVEFERTNYRNAKLVEYTDAKKSADFNEKDWQKKTGQYGEYYRVKDGTVFDPLALNKAIKMAQKSAFVDAVIRTTGMSDLFTQDIEDMQYIEVHEEVQEKPSIKQIVTASSKKSQIMSLMKEAGLQPTGNSKTDWERAVKAGLDIELTEANYDLIIEKLNHTLGK